MHLCVFIFLIYKAQCANILVAYMYPSVSQQVISQKISKELSLRGHKVTALTPNPLKDPTLTNLTEINLDFVYKVLEKNPVQTHYSKDRSPPQILKNILEISNVVTELELESTGVESLILDENQKFDLVLVHSVHPAVFGFVAKYKAPVISISPVSAFSINYDSVGNPNHPVSYPEIFFHPPLKTFWEKLKSIYLFVWQEYYYNRIFVPRAHQMAEKYFGNIPYIGDLQKNVSMFFVYRNILMDVLRPNVPAVLDLSFINTEPPKPLPDDLREILDQATEGVIYVSFGSSIEIARFGKTLKNSILEALPELPYTVLLKSDFDDFLSKSSKIIVRKWYPQKALLAHPNVKVFVTQGGLQSIEEAILAEVPLVGIPFITDQPKNVRQLVKLEIGEGIDPNAINKTVFKDAVTKVAQNIYYKKRIKDVRKILLDKSMTGLESAVWWCEYVIRHKGAKHLKSFSVDMSYTEFVMIDIIFSLFVFIVFCCVLLRKTIK